MKTNEQSWHEIAAAAIRENERIEKELAAWQKQSSQQSELTDELKLQVERLTAENHEYQTALGLIESEWAETPNDKGLIASKSLLNTAQFAAKTLHAENERLRAEIETQARRIGLLIAHSEALEATDGE